VSWDVFSKHNHRPFKTKNVSVQPIHNERFIKSMANSEGILCGAGFETPAEALYMKKKLLVLPMKNQYEQQLNAAALSDMGVPVIKNLDDRFNMVINSWINSNRTIEVEYPDMTQIIIDQIIDKHYQFAALKDIRKSG
jgi:uncharacterized protein (TIGR00661 family)